MSDGNELSAAESVSALTADRSDTLVPSGALRSALPVTTKDDPFHGQPGGDGDAVMSRTSPARPQGPAPTDVNQLLLDMGTATVSDALDRLGLAGSVFGLAPLSAGQRMVGPAFTVRYVPAGAQRGTVGDYLDECSAGEVVVLDNSGMLHCTVWGDILTTLATEKGIAGTAIDGVCRDVHLAVGLGYPIYSRGRFMRTGKDRVEVADTNVQVVLGDTQVQPGDVVVGDDDGLVVVPREHVDQVAAVATNIHDAENGILRAIRGGMTLAAARERHGYHRLQRRDAP